MFQYLIIIFLVSNNIVDRSSWRSLYSKAKLDSRALSTLFYWLLNTNWKGNFDFGFFVMRHPGLHTMEDSSSIRKRTTKTIHEQKLQSCPSAWAKNQSPGNILLSYIFNQKQSIKNLIYILYGFKMKSTLVYYHKIKYTVIISINLNLY